MQKKCKKMQKYLHMSKKSSTFAADLGMVPTITNKCNKSMKEKCIFKCYAQGKWWYVYGVDYGLLGTRYRVYQGRKWYSHISFETRQYAICATVNAVTAGMEGCNFSVVKKV